MAVLCLIVRKMGGGRTALIMAGLSFVASGQLLGFFAFYSMDSLDILFWLVAAYTLVHLAEHGTAQRWLLLGLVLGLGLLTKTSVLWLGEGIGVCLLLTGLRSHLRTRGRRGSRPMIREPRPPPRAFCSSDDRKEVEVCVWHGRPAWPSSPWRRHRPGVTSGLIGTPSRDDAMST